VHHEREESQKGLVVSKRMSWHKGPDDTEYEYAVFHHYLMLPYEAGIKKRNLKAAFKRYCEEKGRVVANPPAFIYTRSKEMAWEERATNYDAHMRAKMQEAEDRGIIRGVQKEAESKAEDIAFNVVRMRSEVADFIDEVGPELRAEILNKLRGDEDHSMASLAQMARVWIDMVKLLDRGEGKDDDETMTDEELQRFLDQESTQEGS
jgi:hypothetical protein